MATKAPAKNAKIRTPNPTLHGLMIARSFSGTVVRGLTFAILVFAVSLVGFLAPDAEGFQTGQAVLFWVVLTAAYLAFDVLYVLLTKIRPFHPRLDRVVLPGALVFSLLIIFAPLIVVEDGMGIGNLWATGAVVLLLALGARLGLTIASTKR